MLDINEIRDDAAEKFCKWFTHHHTLDGIKVCDGSIQFAATLFPVLADAFDLGWDQSRAVPGPACPDDHNVFRSNA
jgi:hypothetical protein